MVYFLVFLYFVFYEKTRTRNENLQNIDRILPVRERLKFCKETGQKMSQLELKFK